MEHPKSILTSWPDPTPIFQTWKPMGCSGICFGYLTERKLPPALVENKMEQFMAGITPSGEKFS
jgi:hypothetical protein